MPMMHRKNLDVCFALLLAGMAMLGIPRATQGQNAGYDVLNPPSLPPVQGYSHVVVAPPGRLVSISGQVAIDSTGAVVGEGDFMAQCVQVFENLSRALHSVGLTFVDVVRTDMFVTNLDHLSTLRECRTRYLSDENPPTSALVKVDALFRSELMLEVAVDAILPAADRNEPVGSGVGESDRPRPHDPRPREPAMALTERDIDAIRALVEQDAEAVRRADWEAVTRMFTADAVRFPPHQPPVRGRGAMRAWLETFPPIEQFDITADEIVGCGDQAFVRGSYVLTIVPQAGEPPQTDRGHYMGLLRKQADGSWLWATDMVSSELPLPG